MHAAWEYNRDEWENLLRIEKLSPEEIGSRVNVTPRHVHNILNGITKTCRFKTVKKIRSHMSGNGIPEERISNLFIRK